MGNALTFPVQSLIFLAIVQSGILCRYGVNCNDVYVFGDDIIFPTEFYDGALDALVRCGLVPNLSKTFRHGFFRESCGVDAFKGFNVTPHRLRKCDTATVSGAISTCTLAKAMYASGYRLVPSFLYRQVERSFGPLPLGNNHDSQGLYRYEKISFDKLLLYEKSIRFNRSLHKWQTRIYLVKGALSRAPSDSWWNLQDSILALHRSGASQALTRGLEYPVPYRERLIKGWTDVLMTSSI
jgi:hypothetical protein